VIIDLRGIHPVSHGVFDGQRVEMEGVFENRPIGFGADVQVKPEEATFVGKRPAEHVAVTCFHKRFACGAVEDGDIAFERHLQRF
jgi:hypothetical protein